MSSSLRAGQIHDADLFAFIAYPDRVTRAIFKDSVRLEISADAAIMPCGIEDARVKTMSKIRASCGAKVMPTEASAMHR
ncbi:hypothetical protein [Paraburkholderia sp. UYCP14C]|uniref:hypothetical protein n=1 Tax=Paraburkholderia sp. UYCP14C TaxID=2511130 RepID=UPI00101EB58B|nr:hypothetical protein [Paraburkholderia sp. UYCP14C]